MHARAAAALLLSTLLACGDGGQAVDVDAAPADGQLAGADAATAADASTDPCDQETPPAEVCDDGLDNDCDDRTDCDDSDCSGLGDCPVCGLGSHDEAAPLALPDGVGAAYTSTLTFGGFAPTQTLADVNRLLGVCVTLEHSFPRDLQIELGCPSGEQVVLMAHVAEGGEFHMGVPVDGDGAEPTPGTGLEYCWTPGAANPPIIDYANMLPGGTLHTIPAGDYQSSEPLNGLVGCTLNGPWTLTVTDLVALDNGFLFSWDIRFDPGIVDDCGVVPID